MKPLAACLEETGMTVEQLVEASGLDAKLVKAIVTGNYTPSPSQRQRLAAALGVSIDDIAWGHTVPVQYLRGNGPQSDRSTEKGTVAATYSDWADGVIALNAPAA